MSEPRKFAPMYHNWYLKIRNWSDRQRLLFFDTLCKVTWEGYTAREGAEDFEYYCDIYPSVWKPEQDSGGGGSDNATRTLAASTARNEYVDDGNEIPSVEFVVNEARQVVDEIWGDMPELYVKDFFYEEMCILGWKRTRKDGSCYSVNKSNVRVVLNSYWRVETDHSMGHNGGAWFRRFFDSDVVKHTLDGDWGLSEAWCNCCCRWEDFALKDEIEGRLRRCIERYFKDGKYVGATGRDDGSTSGANSRRR
jgi:hypothetical protein